MTSTTGTPDYRVSGPFGNDFAINLEFAEFFQRSSQISTVTTNFTMEWWWYPTAVGAAGRTIFRNDTGAASGWGVATDSGATTTKVARATASTVGPASANAPPLNQWSHVAVGRREVTPGTNEWFYYINGQLDTDPVADAAPATPNGVVQLNAGNFLSGRYAYFAVYERALAQSDFLDHLNPKPHFGFMGAISG